MSVGVDDMIDRLGFYVQVRQLGIAEQRAKEFRTETRTSDIKGRRRVGADGQSRYNEVGVSRDARPVVWAVHRLDLLRRLGPT